MTQHVLGRYMLLMPGIFNHKITLSYFFESRTPVIVSHTIILCIQRKKLPINYKTMPYHLEFLFCIKEVF